MHEERRTIQFDRMLGIEAFHLQGVVQRFPQHFHDYYVVGYIEGGHRLMTCGGQEYRLGAGDLTLFEPKQSHACAQLDDVPLDYRGINLPAERVNHIALEFFGEPTALHFSSPVFYHSELAPSLRALHRQITESETGFDKEEALLLILRQLFAEYALPVCKTNFSPANGALDAVCNYMETHYQESVSLDALAQIACLSKYHLLRAFTRYKGISPYQYLTTIRISEARRLLERGMPAIEIALHTGFSDQSHFTNVFKARTGLTPKQYQSIF